MLCAFFLVCVVGLSSKMLAAVLCLLWFCVDVVAEVVVAEVDVAVDVVE